MHLGNALKKLHVVPLKHPIPEGMEDPCREASPSSQPAAFEPTLHANTSPRTRSATNPYVGGPAGAGGVGNYLTSNVASYVGHAYTSGNTFIPDVPAKPLPVEI